MTKSRITNAKYKALLWTLIFFTISTKAYSLLTSFNFFFLVSICIGIAISIFIITKNVNLKLTIKIWTGLTLLGVGLQFLAILLKIIGQQFDKIHFTTIAENTLQLLLAYYLFSGSDKYIENIDESSELVTDERN